MTNIDYFRSVLNTETIETNKWFFSTFSLNPGENDYLYIDKNKYIVKLLEGDTEIENVTTERPLLMFKDPITLTSEDLINVKGTVETTVGRTIFNRLALVRNFGDKIGFINDKVNVGKIESEIAKRMFNTDIITVPEYLNFTKACGFMEALSRLTTVSATYKNMLPPDGIEEYKKALLKEFEEKYGKKWIEDRIKIVEFEKKLKAYDSEWMKGDPTDGNLTSGKVKENARTKMFLTFGAELGFDNSTSKPILVGNSLSQGYPRDKKQLAQMNNTTRSASFARGKETQQGGAVAKVLLRAIGAVSVNKGDCGSKIGKLIRVSENIVKSLNGRYIIENGVSKPIKDFSPYIGKEIYIRSPMFCKSDLTTSICSVCAGEVLSEHKDSIPLMVNNISAAILGASMAAMHNAVIKTTTFDIRDVIS